MLSKLTLDPIAIFDDVAENVNALRNNYAVESHFKCEKAAKQLAGTITFQT